MLGRLIKQELKATSRILIPSMIVWLAIVGLTKMGMLTSSNGEGIFLSITLVLLALASMALSVVLLIIIVSRFYKNLLGDEGYLIFTLPVKTESIILSKLITATIWEISMIVTTSLGFFILIDANDISHLMSDVLPKITFFDTEFVVKVLMYMLVASIFEVMIIYTAIALASLFNKYRVVLSFAFYIGLESVVQTVNMILGFIMSFDNTLKILEIEEQFEASEEIVTSQALELFNEMGDLMTETILNWYIIGIMFVLSVVMFFVISKIFKKHLNLQ